MTCAQCGADDSSSRCTGCFDARYCSLACQAAHWQDGHAETCAPVGMLLIAGHGHRASAGGIRVTGVSRMIRAPDIAEMELSVRVTRKTVVTARMEAASAMAAVRRGLTHRGFDDDDVATTGFSIQPVREDVDGVWKQVGFRVSNTIKVTIRDMDAVGRVVDDATEAGGDAVRVDAIRFAIAHPEQYSVALRVAAAKDARDRAGQIAGAMGEVLGGMISATESGGGARAPSMMMRVEVAAELALATPISAGDLEMRAEVDAVFAVHRTEYP